MTLQQLRYITMVAEKGTISEAAKELFISQPSLTNAIRELEQEMQVTIFHRTNKGVTITAEGDEFLAYARQILDQVGLMQERYLNVNERNPRFSVSCQHYSFAVNAFVDVIRKFDARKYDFTLRETQTYEIIEDVAIGILYTSSQNETIIMKLIRQNDLKFEELFVAKPHVFISSKHPLADKEALTLEDLDSDTFQYCRNILAVIKPNHPWLQLTDEDILLHTRLAKKERETGKLKLKYAALILFGKEEAIEEYMPRYRFEALFHMCTYEEYNDIKRFPSRYDDRITMRCNLIKVYDRLTQFTERYLPNKFYLPEGTTQREDLRWDLFREIVANLCVHSDFSTGYACFYHVFKDRVITKNPTRLLPEIPEGELTLQELSNYTKNPLLVRVFHELSWVEDMGSGTRNILRYAPLYYPDYKVEIVNGSQFIFSITYMEMSQETVENVPRNEKMSQETAENVPRNGQMSQETISTNDEDDLNISLEKPTDKKENSKKNKRHQAIVSLIRKNSRITMEEMADKLGVNARTIHRDIEELKHVVEHIGPTKAGYWKLLK